LEKISSTVDFCKIENLKKELSKPDCGIFANHPELVDIKPASKNPDSAKLRRGVVGGYVDYLSADDIEYCNKHLKNIPREWQYYE